MRVRSTANFLRFVAIAEMIICGIMFMPERWLSLGLAWFGFGDMPHDMLLHYLLRGAAYCQAAFAVLFWVMASDVVRYRPLVVTTAGVLLIGSPTFFLIDTIYRLPLFVRLFNCASFFLIGGVLLALCVWALCDASQTTQPAA